MVEAMTQASDSDPLRLRQLGDSARFTLPPRGKGKASVQERLGRRAWQLGKRMPPTQLLSPLRAHAAGVLHATQAIA